MRGKAGIWGPGGSHGAYWAAEQIATRRTYDAYIGSSTGVNVALFSALGSINPKKYAALYDYADFNYEKINELFSKGWDAGGMSKV
jgi:hypothetical protein